MRFCVTVVLLLLALHAPANDKIKTLLEPIDKWAITDTARILANADSSNKATLATLQASPYWKTANDELTVLLGIDMAGDPRIDNTGRIYYTMRLTGEESALFYTDKPMGFPIQLTPNYWAEQGLSINAYYVYPTGEYVIVEVMKDVNEMQDMYIFYRDGSFKPLLVDETIAFQSPVFIDDNADAFFLTVDDYKGGRYGCRYTISTGKLDTLYSEPEWFSFMDYHHGKVLSVRWFSFSESQIFEFDPETKTTTDLTDKGYYYGGYYTKDGDMISPTTALHGGDYPEFVLYYQDKTKAPKVLYSPNVELDEYYNFSRPTGITTALLNRDGYSDLVAFDIDGNLLPLPKLPIGVAGPVALNDNKQVVYGFSSPNIPPIAYLTTIGSEVTEPIVQISTFGIDFSQVKVELIQYPSTDGTMIPAFLYVPPTAQKNGDNVVLVDYHGGPPGQSRPYFQRNVLFALRHGIMIMYPNVRGSTGYGSAWEKADDQEGRFQALKDAEAALDYLVNEGWSKPEKICIMGASYGGYTVNYLGVHAPDKYACIIAQVGVSDHDFAQIYENPAAKPTWEREFGAVGTQLTYDLSPIWWADNLSKPIMITTGINDPRVTAGDPRRFAKLLTALGKDVLYYEDTAAGHWSTGKSKTIQEYSMYYTFIMMHTMK